MTDNITNDDNSSNNNAVITYPTSFSHMSNSDLHALFRSEIWFGDENNKGLTMDQKLNAVQEVVNRDATANNVDAAKVSFETMIGNKEGFLHGYQVGNEIHLNESIVDKGVAIIEYKDDDGNNVRNEYNIPASNWSVLNTVYHENTHNIQDQLAARDINSDDPAAREHAKTIIANKENYMDRGPLYDVCILEREAKARADEKVKEAMTALEAKWSVDKNSNDYLKNNDNAAVYKSELDDAIARYGDKNIEKTVDQVMMDRTFGTNTVENMDSGARVNRDIENVYGRGYSVQLTVETDARMGPLGGQEVGTQNGSTGQCNGAEASGLTESMSGSGGNVLGGGEGGGQSNAGISENTNDNSNDGGNDGQDNGGMDME